MSILLYSILFYTVFSDIRIANEQPGTPTQILFRIPDTFGILGVEEQKVKDYDQFLRSNVDNEANKRDAGIEDAVDMLPCRQDKKGPIMKFKRGQPIEIPFRWNNPHDSDCEINIWTSKMKTVCPIKKPFPCGGGYQDQRVTTFFPMDFPGCNSDEDGCFMQIYGHSVETRTYAMCIDFVLEGSQEDKSIERDEYDISQTVCKDAIHYWDSFDTSHSDTQFSGYRGQQGDLIRDHIKAVITIRSYLGDGGKAPVDPEKTKAKEGIRKQFVDQVKAAIVQKEAQAQKSNEAKQKELDNKALKGGTTKRECFEGKKYHTVNNPECKRLYQNTFVTNVDYRSILNEFKPKFIAAGLEPYQPKTKTLIGKTPLDPLGQYLGYFGKASQTPQYYFVNLRKQMKAKKLKDKQGSGNSQKQDDDSMKQDSDSVKQDNDSVKQEYKQQSTTSTADSMQQQYKTQDQQESSTATDSPDTTTTTETPSETSTTCTQQSQEDPSTTSEATKDAETTQTEYPTTSFTSDASLLPSQTINAYAVNTESPKIKCRKRPRI